MKAERLGTSSAAPRAVEQATAAAAVAVEVPKYGGEYLEKIVQQLEKGKESATADAGRKELLSRQADALRRLKAAMAARGSTYANDPAAQGDSEGKEGGGGGGFDASVDDDEVLLRLFREVDADGDGAISMEELLGAPLLQKKENTEMVRVLRRALGCDLRALEETLAPLSEADLTPQAGGAASGAGDSAGHTLARGAAIKAIFDAIGPSQSEDLAAAAEGDTRMATRADLVRFLSAVGAPAKGAPLATALEKLAASLSADFLALKEAARKVPRVAAQRLEWVRSMEFEAALARHLPPGTLDDG